MKVNIIVARSKNNVIGNAAGIPWKIKGEQAQFKELTMGEAVVMGRKTYEDIGHPLKGRVNIVVSNTKEFGGRDDSIPGQITTLLTVRSLKEAMELVEGMTNVDLFAAGGARLYEEAVQYADRLYITEVDTEVPVDDTTVFFPGFDESQFKKLTGETFAADIPYTRTIWVRKTSFPERDMELAQNVEGQ